MLLLHREFKVQLRGAAKNPSGKFYSSKCLCIIVDTTNMDQITNKMMISEN